MKAQKVFFAPNKETKRMVQYLECTAKGTNKPLEKQVSRQIYVNKDVIGEDPAEWPALLVVTIEAR